MADVWQQLQESLVGEGRSVETFAHDSMVRAIIWGNCEVVAAPILVENGSQAEFKAAQKKLSTMLAEAGYTPLKGLTGGLNNVYYQKANDPRRPQKIIALDPIQIDEINDLLQDKQYTAATFSYGYTGQSVDSMTVYGYRLNLRGAADVRQSYFISKKGTGVIQKDVDQLLEKHGWVKGATEIDPRGGMEGSTEYSRSGK
jgi:hypothetical protein